MNGVCSEMEVLRHDVIGRAEDLKIGEGYQKWEGDKWECVR